MFVEWDQYLPCDSSDYYWGKCIFLSTNKKLPKSYLAANRETKKGTILSLKDIPSEHGCFCTDIELSIISQKMIPELKISKFWPSLVGVKKDKKTKIIKATKYDQNNFASRITEILEKHLGVSRNKMSLIGSRILGLENLDKNKESDIDVVIELNPDEILKIREQVSKLRLESNEYTELKKVLFPFQYNIRFKYNENPISIDIFPYTKKIEKSTSWYWENNYKEEKLIELDDSRYSHYAWPVLIDIEGNEYIIQSNAFRGAFIKGDHIVARCKKIKRLVNKNQETAYIIQDGLKDIINWQKYINYNRDEIWISNDKRSIQNV